MDTPHPLYPDGSWFRASVDPEVVKRAWDDLAAEAGVSVLLSAHLCGACVEDSRITGVLVHTRAGLSVLRAGRVVDATGDAAICHAAGVAWDRGATDRLWPQAVSVVRRYGGGASGEAGTGGTLAYRPERLGRVDDKQVDPLDPWSVSDGMRRLQRQIWQQAEALPEGQYLLDTAAELGVRTSRIVQGIQRVSDDDAWTLRKAADGIARSSWEIDIHPTDEGPYPERWFHSRSAAYAAHNRRLQQREYFDIPYGCLVAAGVDNLLVAGRCVSAGYLAQGSLRIQQTCMATGQAAGVAAALSLQRQSTPRELDPQLVVTQLARDRDVPPAFPELKQGSVKPG